MPARSLWTAVLLSGLSACVDPPASTNFGEGAETGPESGSSASGASGTPGDDRPADGPGSGSPGAGADSAGIDPDFCGEEVVDVDLLMVIDVSGSMNDLVPGLTATTKWDAVRSAVETFVQSPEATPLGIGLQYFPQHRPGVPQTCETNEACGPEGGACSNSMCVVADVLDVDPTDADPGFPFVRVVDPASPQFCSSDADCTTQGTSCRTLAGECVIPPGGLASSPFGSFLNVSSDPNQLVIPVCSGQLDCAGLPGTACQEVGVCEDLATPCTVSLTCPATAGECLRVPQSCVERTLCGEDDYATPDVAIEISPDDGRNLVTSLRARMPEGLTPTGPALRGAITHAQARAAARPEREVVLILVTDGFATECAPLEIEDIATLAREGAQATPRVRTFVIGVFSQADLGVDGQARLDVLAEAGGTERAIVVGSGSNLADDLLETLRAIPEVAACDGVL